MVEKNKVISNISNLNQIFDDKYEKGSVKGAIEFSLIKKLIYFVICDIPLFSHFVSNDNNPCRYAITCIFQPWSMNETPFMYCA